MIIKTYTVDIYGRANIDKPAGARLDYPFDFTRHLAALGDAIAPVSAAVPAPVSFTAPGAAVDPLPGESPSPTILVAWVAGGTPGSTVPLSCTIVTVGGRTIVCTVYLKIT
jgi:hypothetical protein